MSSSSSGNFFVDLINALDPFILGILDVIPFPINLAIAFIWGGISEVIMAMFM